MRMQELGGSNFLLTIKNKDPLNWQGILQWLDTGEKIEFRSTLEMMALLDEAVQRSSTESAQSSQSSEHRNWDTHREKAV